MPTSGTTHLQPADEYGRSRLVVAIAMVGLDLERDCATCPRASEHACGDAHLGQIDANPEGSRPFRLVQHEMHVSAERVGSWLVTRGTSLQA